MKLKSPLPEYIAFATPELLLAAAAFLEKQGYELDPNVSNLFDVAWYWDEPSGPCVMRMSGSGNYVVCQQGPRRQVALRYNVRSTE